MTATEGTTTDRLAAIRERAERAAKGPWYGDVTGVYDDIDRKMCPMYTDSFGNLDSSEEEEESLAAATATFMAHAREDVPWLLAELARREDQIREIRDVWFRVGSPMELSHTIARIAAEVTEL